MQKFDLVTTSMTTNVLRVVAEVKKVVDDLTHKDNTEEDVYNYITENYVDL